MKITKFFVLSSFLAITFIGFLPSVLTAQNCSPGNPVIAPAGSSVDSGGTVPNNILLYNSQEVGPNSSAARTAVDTLDDNWRSAATAAIGGNVTFTNWNETTTSPITQPLNLFNAGSVNVAVEFKEIADLSILGLCVGATVNDLTAINLSAADALLDNSPRPASFYNVSNQPRALFDAVSLTRNATLYKFSTAPKAFGAWFSDLESRTDSFGAPAVVRLLDVNNNRIGEDIYIQPFAGSQSGCGLFADGCGDARTRWLGFVDSNTTPQVRSMLVLVGGKVPLSNLILNDFCMTGATVAYSSAPTSANVELRGRVRDINNIGIRNVKVNLFNASTMETKIARTSPFGYFSFPEVSVGDFYIMSVAAKNYSFATPSQGLQVFGTMNDLEFIATDNQ